MEHFGAAGGEGVGFIVTQLVEEPRFGGFVRIRRVDAVDISPDDELIGVNNVSDDGSGRREWHR